MAIVIPDWMPIDEHTPKTYSILVYAPPREGLPPLMSVTKWHESAGFCVCEIRQPTIWTNLPYVPKHLQGFE